MDKTIIEQELKDHTCYVCRKSYKQGWTIISITPSHPEWSEFIAEYGSDTIYCCFCCYVRPVLKQNTV